MRDRQALEIVEMLHDDNGSDPMPMAVLRGLQRLVDADSAAGYVAQAADTQRASEWVTRAAPSWLHPVLGQVGTQDPLHAAHRPPLGRALAISDYLRRAEFERLDIYGRVCEPLAVGDSLRLYFGATQGRAHYLFFDRSTRGAWRSLSSEDCGTPRSPPNSVSRSKRWNSI